MEMVFWFGGILGALIFILGLLLLLRRTKGGLTLTLVGLVMSVLLIPALGLFRDSQAYLYIGLAGVVLFVLGLMLFSRGRWGIALLGIGLVTLVYLFPAFKVTEPWNTNPIELVNRLNTPQEVAPAPIPETPTTTEPTPQPDTTLPGTEPTPPSDTTTPPDATTAPPTPTDPTQIPSQEPQPIPTPSETPSTTQPTTPAQPSALPTPDTSSQTQVGATSSDALCPCLLRVTTGITNATVELTRLGGQPLRQMGAVVDFNNLEMGDYLVSVQAAGYNTYSTPLSISNNKSLTVYLLKQ